MGARFSNSSSIVLGSTFQETPSRANAIVLRYVIRMLNRRSFAISLLGIAAFRMPVPAQSHDQKMDPEVMNYKLSMDKIRALDGVFKRLFAEAKSDASLRATFNSSGDDKTLAEMVKMVEGNPKIVAAIKAGGLSGREFCVIPMSVMAAGGAYMIQTQYKKDASSLATAANIAFYAANKTEIEKITSGWSQQPEK